MDKFSLIRSFRHHNSDHGPADHYMLTGYFPQAGFNPSLTPNNQRPAHGSIIARKLGPRGGVPPYVCLPKMHPSGGSAYLGSTAAPFVIDADPNAPNFAVPDIVPPPALAADRLDDRQRAARQARSLPASRRGAGAITHARAVGDFQREGVQPDDLAGRASRPSTSTPSRTSLRDEYGRNTLGQSCLMARRLVEAGVRCVTIDHSELGHARQQLRDAQAASLLPALDAALSTLFRDLADRGLLETTLVVVTGEFGRTPRINKQRRPRSLGPGVHRGCSAAAASRAAASSASPTPAPNARTRSIGPEDLAATIYHLLGIDPKESSTRPKAGRCRSSTADG